MIDRRLIEYFDWVIFFVAFVLSSVGLVNLYSATYVTGSQGILNSYLVKQGLWIVIGLICMFGLVSFDYKHLSIVSIPLYVIGVILLILVLVIGEESHGALRWIALGPIRFQVSEIVKVIMVITVAAWGASDGVTLYPGAGKVAQFLIMVLVPFILIAIEPDLGTALALGLICCTMFFVLGVRKRWLIGGMVFLLMVAYPVWNYGLKEYQKDRIKAVLNPDKDPQRTGYHVRQSKIAIGSGGLSGKGYLKGTQHRLRFLPERHTDFAFAVWAEEFGFTGVCAVLSLYLLLLYRCFWCVLSARDRMGSLIAMGVTAIFMWEVIINVGMVLGFLPVVGMPLPFISYGGSAMVRNWIAVGLIENVAMRRFNYRASKGR
ncbi:rod shape-determining protein RodA [Thermodesulforhabdus norvegica]|uniref:Peptidoglycan glycosyltransferase RodA n=1 Tax=Thermodesulforhabdus norvegica TaxID=39841 RepID=A0A1I4VD46_9BACT|nr:rod shape-determining protein RodA [Thermodesulforhabdus norvegica]SFM99071.1 cell elongation-specific peptidoglycan biosynthesis regulator RodA [Thermodesulforhabdus norvegica]